MQQTFKTNQGPYDDLVTRMFGINDVDAGSSTVDCELGNQLISLHQMVGAYSNSMKETNALVNFASQMTRVIMHLQDRLRGLLGRARFASEMYRLICELGFPERVYSTLVRAAASSKTFEKITFQLPPSIPPKRVSSMSSAKSPSSTRKPVPQQKFILTPVPSTSLLNRKATTSASPTGHGDNTILQSGKFPTVPPKPPSLITASSSPPLQEKSNLLKRSDSACITVTVNTDDPLEAARPYLSHSDHTLSILCLKPASKRITVQLIATILRGTILPVNSEAWYQFGFATTQDEGEERHLAGLYMAILKEAQDPKAIFSELVNAIEENSVVRLFDMNNYSHFRQAFPHLQVFLNTPPAKRPTVWRLNQFVKSDQAVEPPACLQRDYGFKYCRRRDEVERMKAIYDIMLRQVGPMKLHSFCMVNRLYEEGIIKTGIPMKSGDARLMQNDYMTPFVGFDNDLGLAAYRGPFFKRPLKV
ncbi:hypothetical protein J1614_000117 [Plenodomus biglobosus]|nr:hypothetical protein J1614_000117 [Plenodomus biglobosus]